MYTYRVTKPKADNTCAVIGVDMGPKAPIWWEPAKEYADTLDVGKTIVLKITGSVQWASRGEMKYYGTYFLVLKIIRIVDDMFLCDRVIDFPVRQKL